MTTTTPPRFRRRIATALVALTTSSSLDVLAANATRDDAPAPAIEVDPGPARAGSLRVLVWNVQRGANDFVDGPEKALAWIRAIDPDVVLMQESYDVDGERPELGRWIAGRLGWHAHQGTSPHLCVLSRGPIEEPFQLSDWHALGGVVRDRDGRAIVVCSTWIDWRSYLPQALRDDPAIDDDALLACETTGSDRVAQATEILAGLRALGHLDGARPLLVGGDWNCPSHLDWTTDAARVFRHRRALPLPVSRALAAAGFEDAWRLVHPDPVRDPGATWSPLYRGSDEEPETTDRIDRLYRLRRTPTVLHPVAAFTLPRTLEPRERPHAERAFPSDHAAVIVDFEVRDDPRIAPDRGPAGRTD